MSATIKVKEGGVEVSVYGGKATKKMKVFFNPEMRVARDISTLAVKLFKLSRKDPLVIDLLAGSGIRGIRYAKEAGIKKLILNDLNPSAIKLIKRNLKANGVKAEVTKLDGNVLLSSYKHRADVIDIDPFGSPIDFLDSASRAISDGGLLMITATDTAPLSGTYPQTCLRRYGALPLRTDIQHEIGIRILFGVLARELARYEKGLEPLLAIAYKHFFRIFALARKSKADADRSITQIGSALYCKRCGWRALVKEIPKLCENCSKGFFLVAGPLWSGKIFDEKFCSKLASSEMDSNTAKLIYTILDESKIKEPFYDLHDLAPRKKISLPNTFDLIEELQKKGFKASRTHFSKTSVRTNSPLSEIEKILLSLSKRDKLK